MSRKGQKMLHERRVQAGLEPPTELDRANAHRKEQWMDRHLDLTAENVLRAEADLSFWRGIVAQGWCVPPNTSKVLDTDLAEAIAVRVWKTLLADRPPAPPSDLPQSLLGVDKGFVARPWATPPSPPPRGERESTAQDEARAHRVVTQWYNTYSDAKVSWPVRKELIALIAAALAQPPAPPSVSAGRGEEMLRAQLKRYGRHDDTCGFWSNPNMMSDYKCTCGLVAALSRAPEGTAPEGEK